MKRVLNGRGLRLGAPTVAAASLLAIAVQPGALGSTAAVKPGGIFRVSFMGLALQGAGLDYVDPALSYTREGWALLDTTCARLMAYSDKPPPAAFRLVPEVAAGFPRISRDGRTYTFTLRRGFRFSDGKPVRASAFARAVNRALELGPRSPAYAYAQAVVGADAVRSGRRRSASGVVARGYTLVVRFTREVRDFAAWTTMPFFCAVPPALPADREGVGAFPAAGPYYVASYRPGERVVLRRNRYYGGKRPHHVAGFDVDLRATSPGEVLDRIEQGRADWGFVLAPNYFARSARLIERYGLNESQFHIRPGLTIQMWVFNSSRPLFRDNVPLRRAVNFALDRIAFHEGGFAESSVTDQYLPHSLPAFRNASIYPPSGDLGRAKELARGNTRNGRVLVYVTEFARKVSFAQLVQQQLAALGLEVEVRRFAEFATSSAYLGRLGDPSEPWDMAFVVWTPDYPDPYAYINRLLDARYVGGTNLARFESDEYNRLMRRAARMTGDKRTRAYADLAVRLAREAAPLAAIDVLTEPTLVSRRVGCIVLRPAFDLAAACLKR